LRAFVASRATANIVLPSLCRRSHNAEGLTPCVRGGRVGLLLPAQDTLTRVPQIHSNSLV
jgi:hypothetical protein